MKKILLYNLFIIISISLSCQGQKKDTFIQLSVTDFAHKIQEFKNAPIIDVRTPKEYASGHLLKAQNINWNATSFENKIITLDKNNPVFIYCRSGGRSSAAAQKMLTLGFTKIYELDEGIIEWSAQSKPITTK